MSNAWDALGRGIESGINNAVNISKQRKDAQLKQEQQDQVKAYQDAMLTLQKKQQDESVRQYNEGVSRQNLQDLYNLDEAQKERDLRWRIANLQSENAKLNARGKALENDAYLDGKYNSARMTSLMNNYFKESNSGYNWIDFANEYDANNPEHIKMMNDAINFAVSHDASFYDPEQLRADVENTIKQRVGKIGTMEEYGRNQQAIHRENEVAKQERKAEQRDNANAWIAKNSETLSIPEDDESIPAKKSNIKQWWDGLVGKKKKTEIASNDIIGNYR